ncbi:MAG: topoisomerase IV, partial [Clostridia bacterium]|nr:topoisomerase IV [Clostridia bacterium]
SGIAVGMASNICSFNLREICETTIGLMKDPEFDVFETLQAPDFIGGGQIVYDRAALEEIYNTGRGSIRVRARYRYDKANNCIDIIELPPTTTCEAVIDKIIEKVKAGTLKEISDIRDETDKSGLKITIDLKRGTDPDKLMKKLYRSTPLEDSFSANFNVLVGGVPRVMGVAELLNEWIAFRSECVSRRVYFDLTKAKEKLHLLTGLKKILLDIDKAIKIVRETEEESEVVPNLMIGFGIDETQAEYVAEIKLRHLNREYILKRLADVDDLQKSIADMEDTLANKSRIKRIIIDELKNVEGKYGKDRRSEIIYDDEPEEEIREEVPDYEVNLFFTRDGYFKKITPLSLRMSGEQKLKEGDELTVDGLVSTNAAELLFFTDRCQVYKARVCDFEDAKASVLGDYVPTKLEFEPDEKPVYMAVTSTYDGYMLFCFENGKVAKVTMAGYATKTNRKKLIKAYCDKSPLVTALYIHGDTDVVMASTSGRVLLVNTGAISPKSAKDTLGVSVMTQRKYHKLASVHLYREGEFEKPHRYRTKTLPAAGATRSAEDTAEQLTLE